MSGYQLLGAGIVAAVLIGFYVMTAVAMGWRMAAGIWGLSYVITAVVVVGALLFGGVIP